MKKNSLRPMTAALFALMVLLAAACGGDDSTGAAVAGDHSSHGGDTVEIPEGMAVPSISISAEPDSVSGHNLFIDLENFEIAPLSASTDPVDGEGHLHLYVNGERQMRFYNTALHLTGLPEGEHEVMVEVSANNHSAYAVDGEPVVAMTTVTVNEGQDAAGDGQHGDGEGAEPAGHGGHGGDDGHSDAELVAPAEEMTLEVEISEDPASGWNVRTVTSGFDFAPEDAGEAAVDGEGHLHLYVDGERVTRLYGEWWHLGDLKAGTREIMIEAATNDHKGYGVDGQPVMVMTTLEVSEDQAVGGGHDHGGGGDGEHGRSGSGEAMDMPAADADNVVDVTVADDEIDVPDRRIEVEEGETVGISVESDIEDQIHVHGYDLLADIGPDGATDLAFLADSPGVFEVELEQSGRFLFEIVVS